MTTATNNNQWLITTGTAYATTATIANTIKNYLGVHWPKGSCAPPKWEISNGNPYKRSELDRDWYVYCKPLDEDRVQADIYAPGGIQHTIVLPIDAYYERAESLLYYFVNKRKYEE